MEKQLVIAKYKEDISWLGQTKIPSVVYDKEVLENRGREASTFLMFMIEHYDTLPDFSIFSQAYPFNSCPNFLETIKESFTQLTSLAEKGRSIYNWGGEHPDDTFETLGSFQVRYGHRGVTKHAGHGRLDLRPLWEDLFVTKAPEGRLDLRFAYGSFWAVPKDLIMGRSLAFWQHCLDLIQKGYYAPEIGSWGPEPSGGYGWAFEILWDSIFDPNLVTKL